jgi:hypothetical protein
MTRTSALVIAWAATLCFSALSRRPRPTGANGAADDLVDVVGRIVLVNDFAFAGIRPHDADMLNGRIERLGLNAHYALPLGLLGPIVAVRLGSGSRQSAARKKLRHCGEGLTIRSPHPQQQGAIAGSLGRALWRS